MRFLLVLIMLVIGGLAAAAAGGQQVNAPRLQVGDQRAAAAAAAREILSRLSAEHRSRIAILHDADEIGVVGRDALRDAAPQFKVSIAAEEAYSNQDTDMTVQLTRLRVSDPEAIVVWGRLPGTDVVSRQAKQLGITIPLKVHLVQLTRIR
jgi:branched-chain amino acid transport system substrate-binding protein